MFNDSINTKFKNKIEISGFITKIDQLKTIDKTGDTAITFKIQNKCIGRTNNLFVTAYKNTAKEAAKFKEGDLVIVEGQLYQDTLKNSDKIRTMIRAEHVYPEYDQFDLNIPYPQNNMKQKSVF
jgi:single-stranded DNA-binding protein